MAKKNTYMVWIKDVEITNSVAVWTVKAGFDAPFTMATPVRERLDGLTRRAIARETVSRGIIPSIRQAFVAWDSDDVRAKFHAAKTAS